MTTKKSELPTRHYDKLRAYLFAVMKDMIDRGKIRRAHGQSLDDVLRVEGRHVLQEIEGDITRLAQEMGLSLLGAIHDIVTNAASQGQDYIFNLFFGQGKRS